MASYSTNGQLVVEVPLKSDQKSITQNWTALSTHGKISLNCSVPKGIDPSKVSVTCSDRDLIIKA
jgi:hypothetical protein